MTFLELAKKRYSVRAYKSTPVEDEKLQQVLEAARLAPTAANHQALQFIVIHTKGREEELKRIYGAKWFTDAPIVICGCGISSKAYKRQDGKNYSDIDVTIVMDHLIMAATDLGLGTCWIAAFNAEATREILKLPDEVEPVIFTTLGYPDDKPKAKSRKPLNEVIRYEHW